MSTGAKRFLIRARVTYFVEREIRANSRVEALIAAEECKHELHGATSNAVEVEIDGAEPVHTAPIPPPPAAVGTVTPFARLKRVH